MKHEELAGVRVDNCDLREALKEVEGYLGTAALNTVEAINMKTVVSAGNDGDVRQCLESLDLVFPADREILQGMGIDSEQRMNEVQENLLFHETMEMARERNFRLYLLTADSGQEDLLREHLADAYGKELEVCGSYCVAGASGGDPEDVVNEINAVAPDVILSALPTPEQEYFIRAHRHMLNAKLWFGIGAESELVSPGNTPGRLYRKMVNRRRMKRQIQSYGAQDDGQ